MSDTMNECVIEWIKNDTTASVTMPIGTRLYNRIKKLAETNDDVHYWINKDGSMFATLPASWVKINPTRTMSEERKTILTRQLERVRRSNIRNSDTTKAE